MGREVTAYLGLGANLGDRESNLRRVLEHLQERMTIEQVSSLYETEPVGYREQPKFLNAACHVSTDLAPFPLLSFLKGIETDMGRDFTIIPRPIDLDILFYGRLVLNTPELTIPHPRLAERAFVLAPLAEIAPALVHPVLGRTIMKLLAAVEGKDSVRKWEMRLPLLRKCDR